MVCGFVAAHLVLALARPGPSLAAAPTLLSIDDLYRHDAVVDPILTHEDTQVVYVREWAERDLRYRRMALYRVRRDPKNAEPLEPGQPDARRPVLSPDGRWIAFLSTRPLPDGKPLVAQVPVWSDPATDIWLIPVDGGDAIPLIGARKPYGRVFSDPFYGRVAFSPDGRRLVFVADDGRDSRTEAELATNVTVVQDDQGEGYEGYRAAGIWVADLELPNSSTGVTSSAGSAATRARRLTPDEFWYGDPQWSPDSQSLYVHANRTEDRESVRFSINKNFDIWRIAVDSGRMEQLTHGNGPQVSPRISPDGTRLLCLSVPRNGPHTDVYNLELIELTDQPRGRVLFDHHGTAATDPSPPHHWPTFPLPSPCWLDARWLLVDTARGISVERQLIDADSPHGSAAADGPARDPHFRRGQEQRVRLLPESNPYLRERQLGQDEIVRWKSSDGLDIDGVLTRPPELANAKTPYKLLVYPHGGPHSRATPGFNFTVQLFAANGYAVFQPNFRGTSGYGKRFLDADRGDLGGGDMQDIQSGIDQLAREGIVDPDRQFVYGISYGGFMTCWLVGHTRQFRAAVAQNAVTEMNVMWGVGDLRSWTEWELGGLPWQVPDAMRQRSPFHHVDRVITPTMILHADHDRRCPLPMGQMFHRGLKARGVETQMIIYHDERHAISQLPHQADIYRRVLDWFARHDREAEIK